jgi:hypothetical protein
MGMADIDPGRFPRLFMATPLSLELARLAHAWRQGRMKMRTAAGRPAFGPQ